MNKFMRKHNSFMRKALKDPIENLDWLMSYHESKIQFLQHERLIHLLVTLAFSFVLLLSCGLFLYKPTPFALPIFLLLSLLLLFYVVHYFRLENCVQRWYILHQKLMRYKNTN